MMGLVKPIGANSVKQAVVAIFKVIDLPKVINLYTLDSIDAKSNNSQVFLPSLIYTVKDSAVNKTM